MAHKDIPPTTHAGSVDIRNMTFVRGFCSTTLSRTIWATRDDPASGPADQSRRASYRHAREIAASLNAKRIIEISRHPSDALAGFFTEDGRALYGVYQQPTSDKLKQSRVSMHECHLGYYPSVEGVLGRFEDGVATVYVLADVLEYVHDPRPLLRRLRINLMAHPDNRAVVSTGMRTGTNTDPDGLPADRRRIRQWDLDGLADLMASAGFKIERGPDGPTDNPDREADACLLELSCNGRFYSDFLRRNGLPEPGDYLMIVSENGAVSGSGPLVRYVKEVGSVVRNKPIVLFTGRKTDLPDDLTEEWICLETPVRIERDDDISDSVFDAFVQLIFFYGGITLVEIQDYLGHGYRIAQAKRAGLLPPDMCITVRCHGSAAYLDHVRGVWTKPADLPALYREKELIDKADLVSFPSAFVKDIYIERGYELGTRAQIEPYCFTFGKEYAETASAIRRLIFFDGRAATGARVLTGDVLRELDRRGLLRTGIREILCIRPNESEGFAGDWHPKDLRKKVKITYRCSGWKGFLDLASEGRAQSVCVYLPGTDSAIFPTLELIDSCCPFLVTGGAGVSEVVPDPYRARVVTDNTARSIAGGIAGYLEMGNEERLRAVNGLKDAAADNQKEIHKDFSARIEKIVGRKINLRPERPVSGGLVSVIVPLFNPRPEHLKDLAVSLNNQTVRPKEVVFVDDGSDDGRIQGALQTITSTLTLPWRVIRQENRGPSVAKNRAVKSVTTKYVIALDSDNMLLPDFTYKTVSCMENNPDYAVVTSYIDLFTDGDNYEDPGMIVGRIRPKYASIIMGQIGNVFGDNTGCYRRDVLDRVGGWDEYGRIKAGDWALYMNLTCRGYSIGVINRVLALYRLREDSAVKTMNRYVSDSCVARNTVCLPRFEAYSLFGLCRNVDALVNERELTRMASLTARRVFMRLMRIPILKGILLKVVLPARERILRRTG